MAKFNTTNPARSIKSVTFSLPKELRAEIIRKTLHLSIAATPAIAHLIGIQATVLVLAAGVLFYTLSEWARLAGFSVPFVSRLTVSAMRLRDRSRFVVGPITLGLGAMLAIQLYPMPAASIAIYSLAFGDGLSSLVGKLSGNIILPGTGGKSLEGSITCFMSVLIAGFAFVPFFSWPLLLLIAFVATVLEALPLTDFDNLLIPLGVGVVAALVL